MGSSGDAWKLKDHPKLHKGKTVAVIVLDGWGEAKPNEYNAISVAETPVMDSLKKVYWISFFWLKILALWIHDLLYLSGSLLKLNYRVLLNIGD